MPDSYINAKVEMTSAEKMDSARTVLLAEAARYMLDNSLPAGGRGTVSSAHDKQQIVGMNDDSAKSTINWEEKPSRLEFGYLTQTYNTFGPGAKGVEHDQIPNSDNPNISQDSIAILNEDGIPELLLKGTCKSNGNRTDCSYVARSDDYYRGSVKVSTQKDSNDANQTAVYDSTISVSTLKGKSEAKMNYTVARDTATYSYEKIK